MNNFLMLVGLPGSGKSFYAKTLENYEVFSSDTLRAELFGDENSQENNEKLFSELHKRIKNALSGGENVVYDACNINYKRRKQFLEGMRNISCYKSCCIIATPYNKCLEQNENRDRKVPPEVIKKMYTSFYIPQYYEGWDNIYIIDNFNKNDFDLNILFNGLNNNGGLNKINHDSKYHTLTIGQHCSMCCTKLEEILQKASLELLQGALLHDIGKKFTKSNIDVEVWKPISGLEDLYEVSSFGRIKNIKRDKILKNRDHSGGYLNVHIKQKNQYVHRLVAKYFVEIPNELKNKNNLDVNHIDGNKKNNFYKNLEWCTRKENQIHAFYTNENRNFYGEKRLNSKLKNEDITKIKNLKKQGLSNRKVASLFGVDGSVISRVNNNKAYVNKIKDKVIKINPIIPQTESHYFNHHFVSAYDSLFYAIDGCDRIKRANYIQWHMKPYFIETEKAKNKFINLVGEETYKEIMILHEADKLAH